MNKEDQSMNEENKSKRFYTFKQWSDEKGDPSEGALRWMHHTNKDGFSDECVMRRGRRVLISEENYYQWLEKINKEVC